MKLETKKKLYIAIIFIATTLLLLATSFIAVKYYVGNITLFAAMMIVVPIVLSAISAFLLGWSIKWSIVKGICIALALTLISWGVSSLSTQWADTSMPSMSTDTENENADDELMNELYDELDKKAYEYMLEQGLISEGEEIHGGEAATPGSDSAQEPNTDDGELHSEMYVGIQASDPATELVGNVMNFLIALGACFAGNKIQQKSKKLK